VGVKLAEIVGVTGFSKSFASIVRTGRSQPHHKTGASGAIGSASGSPDPVAAR